MAKDQKKAPAVAETKEQKFSRLASVRTRKVLKALDTLIGTANPNVYRWNEAQANQIVDAIQGRVKDLHSRLASPGSAKEKEPEFTV